MSLLFYNQNKQNGHNFHIEFDNFKSAYFAFLGEFGYELISWIPYLLYLKRTYGYHLNTISRPDSDVFYYFSDNHQTINPKLVGDMWGFPQHYHKLQEIVGSSNIIHPLIINNQFAEQFAINNNTWSNTDIHKVLNTNSYILPNYREIADDLPFELPNKFVLINNKFQRQWFDKFNSPINFFSADELKEIRDILYAQGYSVVYNNFVEATSYDEYFDYDDKGIFGSDGNSVHLSDYYNNLDISKNHLQLSVINQSEFAIGVQGGNVYLPSLCGKDLLILIRDGIYLDYLELARINKHNIHAFYEGDHLVNFLPKFIKSIKNLGHNDDNTKFYFQKSILGNDVNLLKIPESDALSKGDNCVIFEEQISNDLQILLDKIKFTNFNPW